VLLCILYAEMHNALSERLLVLRINNERQMRMRCLLFIELICFRSNTWANNLITWAKCLFECTLVHLSYR